MAAKNFVFRENWVGSRWLVRKQPFLPFLTQPGPTFWLLNAQINNSFRSILVKKDRNYIIINTVTLRLTNESEILKNNLFFAIFNPNWAKNLVLMSFKYGISSFICLKFPLRCLYNHFLLLLKVSSM